MDKKGYIGDWIEDYRKPTLDELWETYDALAKSPNEFDFTVDEMYETASDLFNTNIDYIKASIFMLATKDRLVNEV